METCLSCGMYMMDSAKVQSQTDECEVKDCSEQAMVCTTCRVVVNDNKVYCSAHASFLMGRCSRCLRPSEKVKRRKCKGFPGDACGVSYNVCNVCEHNVVIQSDTEMCLNHVGHRMYWYPDIMNKYAELPVDDNDDDDDDDDEPTKLCCAVCKSAVGSEFYTYLFPFRCMATGCSERTLAICSECRPSYTRIVKCIRHLVHPNVCMSLKHTDACAYKTLGKRPRSNLPFLFQKKETAAMATKRAKRATRATRAKPAKRSVVKNRSSNTNIFRFLTNK